MKQIATIILLLSLFGNISKAQYYGVSRPFESKWTLGLQAGIAGVSGDVSTDLRGAFHASFMIQKSLSRVVDLRLHFSRGRTRGLNTFASSNFRFNDALNGERTRPPVAAYDTVNAEVYHNYSMDYWDGALNLRVNFNRMFSKSGGENWDLYGLAGIGTMLYSTSVDALDSDGSAYDYSSITVDASEAQIRQELDVLLDGEYETQAQQDYISKNGIGTHAFATVFSIGGGFRMKLSERLAVSLESAYYITQDDLLDGQQWDTNNRLSVGNDSYYRASIGLDFTFPPKRE
ncbi:MAG: hypothetical protein AAGI38_11030 [Bacteroidota bacterium]